MPLLEAPWETRVATPSPENDTLLSLRHLPNVLIGKAGVTFIDVLVQVAGENLWS